MLYGMEGPLDTESTPPSPWKAAVRREGKDVSLIAYGGSLHKALGAADELEKEGIVAEVVDLRSLRPLDHETIVQSVSRTHRAVVIDEAWKTGSLASEISAILEQNQNLFSIIKISINEEKAISNKRKALNGVLIPIS